MEIQPDKQNIDKLFSNTTYYIDTYQRQYKWTDEPVQQLFNDVFYRFNKEYRKHKDTKLPLEQIINQYDWYYLNSYVTNKDDGKLFVVDGQQRLTTLTLILIKLKHLADDFGSQLSPWIGNKICGMSGYNMDFWMSHDDHKVTMQELLSNKPLDKVYVDSGLSALNMVNNFSIISSRLESELADLKRFETFVFYFLNRLVMIHLNIPQTDVSMVFEVINDRGIKLKPYENLKAMLIGQVSKAEQRALKLDKLWERQVAKINSFKDDLIDNFFVFYLKARHIDTVSEGRKYDTEYHRAIFSENKLDLEHNPQRIIEFLQNDYIYYTNLYAKIFKYHSDLDDEFRHVYFNGVTDMDMQFLIIMSVCKLQDPEEDEKIKAVSYELDRLFCLLQLQRSYSSHDFANKLLRLSISIRNADVEAIRPAFTNLLQELLSEARGIAVTSPVSYGFFKESGSELEKRFKRYFFARIEIFIADNTKMNMKHTLYDLVQNTGSTNGFHIEHILANNPSNLALFEDDDEVFESERNRLGGLLLLKGRDNISGGNEEYKSKLASYANTLYWNETLRTDSYHSKLDFTYMINKYKLNFRPMEKFGPLELEERHKLLFDMVKQIWR